MAALAIIVGLVALTAGAELLVRGAVRLARAVALPSLVIGLTVVAFGTSAPELAVSVRAGLAGQGDIAVGNVVGSNTFNILFILGVSALVAPLVASSQLVRLDVPVMIGASALAWLLAADGSVGRAEGTALALGVVAYTVLLVALGKRKQKTLAAPAEAAGPVPRTHHPAVSVLLVLTGLALLVLGARWLVDGAVDVARALGVGELVIGATIVAAGTSVPEAATSIVASIRGERDIAIGNVVGSNIFNLLAVLGVSAAVSPGGIAVSPAALRFDVPVMVAVAVACLPVFFTGGRVSRVEGGMFLAYYAAYVAVLVLAAVGQRSLAGFSAAMVWFVIPLSVLGVGLSVASWIRRRRTIGLQDRPAD